MLPIRTAKPWLAFLLTMAILAPLGAQTHAEDQAAQRASPVLDLPGYIAELDRWSAAIGSLTDDPVEIARLEQSLPPSWQVRAGGQQFAVATSWLKTGLDAVEISPGLKDSVRQELGARLRALRDAAQELAQPASPELATEARARLNGIFQRREFRALRGPTWWDRLRERIWVAIGRLLEKIFGKVHLGASIGNLLAWAVIALAFLVFVVWVIRTLAHSSQELRLESSAEGLTEDSRNWARSALAAGGRGDYREAIRCAYWAGIARLEELGALTSDRSRTPREALRFLATDDEGRAPLGLLTQRFELIWYGDRPASAPDWDDARMQLERMGCLLPPIPATANS